MRTAAWLEKLDGGIDYLKEVVVQDSLEICEDLDRQMHALVDTYKCEWKEAIENIEIQNRYSHFVNSDAIDENLNFVPLRTQKMPELWKS
jgi:nitrite reductase (NADH) large subunit